MIIRIESSIHNKWTKMIVVLFATLLIHSTATAQIKSDTIKLGEIIWPEHNELERPLLRDSFNLNISSFSKIRLYHSTENDDVRTLNIKTNSINNDSFLKDLTLLFHILHESHIDSTYLGTSPNYDSNLDIKVMFLTKKDSIGTHNLELFLNGEDISRLTIREYYVINSANYYVLDLTSMLLLKDMIIQVVNQYSNPAN